MKTEPFNDTCCLVPVEEEGFFLMWPHSEEKFNRLLDGYQETIARMQATDRKSHNPKPFRHMIAEVKEVGPFSLILSLWIRHGKVDTMYRPFFVLCGVQDAADVIARLIEIYAAYGEADFLPFGLRTSYYWLERA
jgi:hypothetical protein